MYNANKMGGFKMKFKYFKGVRKCLAIVLTLALVLTALPDSLSGILVVKAADPEITTTTTTYNFLSATTAIYAPTLGAVMDSTKVGNTIGGIYYQSKGTSSGVNFQDTPFVLRFRVGSILYFPIKGDTTKVDLKMLCNGEQTGRHVFVGEATSTTDYTKSVAMSTTEKTVTISDISSYIKDIGGVKYLPLISDGDIKVTKITIVEYNPINSVTVSGHIENATSNGVTQVKFKNQDNPNAAVVTATVDASGNYSAALKRIEGSTNYIAVIAVPGFKIDTTGSANKFKLTGNGATATNDFSVVSAPIADVSGTITGVPDIQLKGTFKATLVPTDATLDSVELALTRVSDGNYTYANVSLDANKNYNVVLTSADDYEVLGSISKTEGTYTDVAIAATAKPLQTVSGSFVTSDKNVASVTSITFTNISKPTYTYTFNVTGGTYSANLRAAEYTTSAVCSGGYTVYDHVSVAGTAVANDVYLQVPADTSVVTYVPVVQVGTGQTFKTIASAVAYISRMTRAANERVTIMLTDELYREQVIINTPNVTINSALSGGSKITWYYGVGYSYYSAKTPVGTVGAYYDEACAVDKYYKATISQNPGHWGATVNLFAGATGFKSENITFENSLTRYMTTDEVADGVTTNVIPTMVDRSTATDADVLIKANKERSAAIYIQADNSEYKDCKFLSSQDTIYSGDTTEHSYFTNCLIEGTTDYICGDGNPVFDACTLSMYSYSDQDAIASYIVASKGTGAHGYLFNNCKIVTTSFPGLHPTYGNILARAWGSGIVNFINTEVESANMISNAAYMDMNVTVASAHYSEYNTHTPDGTPVDTSGRVAGVTILTKAQAAQVSITSYFDSFAPIYYVPADYTQVNAKITTANGLTQSNFVDFSTVTAAIAAVVFSLNSSQQSLVNTMASNILNAINALVKKSADYSAFNAKIVEAKALDSADYSTASFSALTTAIATAEAVPTSYKIDEQGTVTAAEAELNTAILNLVTVGGADYSAFNAAIVTAKAITPTTYTTASFSTLTTAIATADSFPKNLKAGSQSTVNDAVTSLNSAVTGLVKLSADYTALNSAIITAQSYTSVTYTTASYSALTTAITTAQGVVSAAYNIDSQSTVNDAVTALNSAVAGLVKLGANYTALNTAITTAQSYTSATYTTASFSTLTTAITTAQGVVSAAYNIDSQSTVNAAVTALNGAVAGLVKLGADYSALNSAITTAQAYTPATYTAASYLALTTAITTAQGVVSAAYNIDSQSTVNTAVTALNSVVAALVKKDADYSALTAAIASAEILTSTTYTTGSYAAVGTALTAAKAVSTGLKIDSQGTIDTAVTNLNSAVAALVKKGADYSALTAAITSTEALTATNYITYAAVSTALTAAKAVATGLKIDSQSTINTAVTNLNGAVTALVFKDADYSKLTAAITSAQALTSSIYTTESFAAVTTKLTAAKAVATGLKINNQSTIDVAVTALNNAVTALVKLPITIAATGNTETKLVDPSANIEQGSKFEVKAVTSGDVYEKAATIVKAAATADNLGQFVVFELNLSNSDGIAITQLAGKVSVSLPVPAGLDITKTITVFRVETNGSLTKLDTKIVDGKCVFETDHFSTYVIAQVVADAVVVAPVVEAPVVTPDATPAAPKTGDTSPITMYMLIMGIAAGTVLYTTKKRKIKRV